MPSVKDALLDDDDATEGVLEVKVEERVREEALEHGKVPAGAKGIQE